MKFGKGTAAALWNSSVSDISTAGVGTPANGTWAVLLFKGTMPTLAEFNAAMNSPNFQDTGTTNREPYLNYQDLIQARTADYLGGVTGRYKFDAVTLDMNKIVLRLNAAAIGSNVNITGSTHPRLTVIVADGTPTWFAVVGCTTAAIQMNTPANLMSGGAALASLGLIGTVGDETSSADLRIKGGKVYANTTDLTNQNRSINISDLILTLN